MNVTAAAVILAGGASSCDDSIEENSEANGASYMQLLSVPLPDGRGVNCAFYGPNSQSGAIDCDWAHASPEIVGTPGDKIAVVSVPRPDGSTVLCAIYAPNSGIGAISCDWATR